MPISIPLADCPGLIHLMLSADELSPTFDLNGARCSVENIDGNACFDALKANFDLMLIFPGWYLGEHGQPAYIIIMGETHECLQWLPIDRADKQAILAHLSLSPSDRALCQMSI